MSLDSEYSNNGRITCNITSSFVGNQNASYIVEGEYGRSVAGKDIRHVSWDQHIYMFQTYAGKVVKFVFIFIKKEHSFKHCIIVY